MSAAHPATLENVRGRYPGRDRDREDVRFDTDSDTDPDIPVVVLFSEQLLMGLWRTR